MISLKGLHRSAATKASHYYADQKDDYYSRDDNAAQWQGNAAEALGLVGKVRQADLARALRGEFGPNVQLSKSIRLDAKSRAALDMTFSPPKSVSIQALVGKDPAALNAHDVAVTRALVFVEQELVRARHKVGGITTMERTGNTAIAKFRHETARPTDGAYSDPQLHTHALLMNITQRADGSWVAISNDDIYRLKSMAETVYHAELASELEKAGHTLRYENKTFELAHISRDQIEGFSKRSQDINAELEAIGESRESASRALKQSIALQTRHGKAPEITREELQRDWQRQAELLGVQLQVESPSLVPTPERTPAAVALLADECLRWAVAHHTERESVFRGDEVLKTALHRSHGTGVGLRDLKRAVARSLDRGHMILGTLRYRSAEDIGGAFLSRTEWTDQLVQQGHSRKHSTELVRQLIANGQLLPTGASYTTQVAREREKRILQIEREGRGKVTPVLSAETSQSLLGNRGLKPGQLAAASLILSTPNQFTGVQGLAGTGKSHMLAEVKAVAGDFGYKVMAVASYGKQIEALRELGMEARTIASVLASRQVERFNFDEKTILVIDEAGVVATRNLERLLQIAEKAGARVVMLGDTGQTKAIEAGRPFHQLQDAGMATALMDDIQRQRNPILKHSVELAATGQASKSLGVLSAKLQAVKEIEDNGERYGAIAARYVGLDVAARDATLIVTGTNASRNSINDATHDALGLSGQGFAFNMLTRRDTTQAERRVAKYFVAGDIIQPERDYAVGNLRRGEMYRVIGSVKGKANSLEIEHVESKERVTINPARATKLSVYEPVRAELSAGDWVRVTRNNDSLDLVNGARFQVLAVTPTKVIIGSAGRRVVLDAATLPLHLDRAYATTVHSAQGLTCDRVLINAESFTRTTQRDVYYVAISRARDEAEIYTDDAAELGPAVNRLVNKSAALDIGLESTRPWRPVKEATRSMEAGR